MVDEWVVNLVGEMVCLMVGAKGALSADLWVVVWVVLMVVC